MESVDFTDPSNGKLLPAHKKSFNRDLVMPYVLAAFVSLLMLMIHTLQKGEREYPMFDIFVAL